MIIFFQKTLDFSLGLCYNVIKIKERGITMRAKKIEVVTRMVQNGYCLFNETVEQFADRFDLSTLLCFEESFSANRQK